MRPLPPLRRADLAPDPLEQLRRWLAEGRELAPSSASTVLCTVGADGRPRARTVPIRAVDDDGVVLHTHRGSAKGADLLDRPDAVSMLVCWPPLVRQLRIDARAELFDDDAADAAFAQRPRSAQLRAWATPGFGEVEGRGELERVAAEVATRFGEGPVPRPPGWAVVRLVPRAAEVFQGAGDDCHDRFAFRPHGHGWSVTRLVP